MSNNFKVLEISIIFCVLFILTLSNIILSASNFVSELNFFFYLVYLLIFSYSFLKFSDNPNNKFIFIQYIYLIKIPLIAVLHYIMLVFYDGGDMQGYYYSVVEGSGFWKVKFHGLTNVDFVKTLNSVFFSLFPVSFYGFELFSGILSAFIYYLFYRLFSNYSERNTYIFLVFLCIPSVALFSSYVGKETYILPAIFLAFYIVHRYQQKKMGLICLVIFFSLIAIFAGLIRAYQGLILFLSLYLMVMSFSKFWLLLSSFFAFILLYLVYPYLSLIFFGEASDLTSFYRLLNRAYSGGNLTLEPLSFPFSLLQVFRPFPWEFHNLFSLYVSLESMALLFLCLYLVTKNFGYIVRRIKSNKIYLFTFYYVFINLFLFSFSDNLGDLVRRKIYFIPFLLVLLIR